MILGYNKRRPTKENYEDFESKLVNGLKKIDIGGLSLMFHGSYLRNNCEFGRSDIDATMTFANDVVINKKDLRNVAEVLHNSLKGNLIPFQVSVTDISTMRDGRFNTYNRLFRSYFANEGKIIVGPDYRNEFNYELPSMDDQSEVSFNIRKSRIGLLYSIHDWKTDYEKFLENFNATLNSVSRASKQVLQFIDGKLRINRFEGIKSIPALFPEVDCEPLNKIKFLYSHLDELDKLYHQPEDILELWKNSLTSFEQLIKSYINLVPKNKNANRP